MPRLSILIPNFNNGRQSARDGRRDLIGDLLESLHATLHADPTRLEIIAYDDGSTDDSLETLREWSKKTWRDGQPFLELIEAEHCGVLAKTANIMSRKARGEFLARLDGDTICLTPHWAEKLCEIFDSSDDRVGVIGPKQLRPDFRIHAFGDFVLHPHGYTHVAGGMPRDKVQHAMEVDHVMGCFYCCRKAVFDDLGGYDEKFLRGQTIDFGMRARLNGWRALAVPNIEYIHAHGTRVGRPTEADTAGGIAKSLKTFEDKWGFNRIAPDLDVVRERYAGTPLLWNKHWFGDNTASAAAPFKVEQSDWIRYANEHVFQSKVNFRAGMVMEVIRQTRRPETIVQLGCGDGLTTHLLATQGLNVIGVDDRPAYLDFASQCAQRHRYSAAAPRFEIQQDPHVAPLEDRTADMVLLFDCLERHLNPVGLLKEARRILRDGGLLLIVSPRLSNDSPDPSEPATIAMEPRIRRFRFNELTNIAQGAGGFNLAMQPNDDPSRDLVLLLSRISRATDASEPATRVA